MKPNLIHLSLYRVRKGEFASDDLLGNYGAFKIPLKDHTWACCIVADGDDTGWEHVSVHMVYQNGKGRYIERTPTWEEMAWIKDQFWMPEETVIQLHPPKSRYINIHSHTLHLWKPETLDIPLPPLETV